MVALPGQLFYSTGIPACLWFLTRDKKTNAFRNRIYETLFIDARNMGILIDRTHKDLTQVEIDKIATVYNAWRGKDGKYENIRGL